MSELNSVPPFSNHSAIPEPLRVLVAQTPFLPYSHETGRQRQLLAQSDLLTSAKLTGIPLSHPVVYTMQNVVKEAEDVNAVLPTFLAPIVEPARGSPYPESDYMVFHPFRAHEGGPPAVAQATAQTIVRPAVVVCNTRTTVTATAVKAQSLKPAAVADIDGTVLLVKPSQCSTSTEGKIADAWGRSETEFTELKAIAGTLAKEVGMDLSKSLESNRNDEYLRPAYEKFLAEIPERAPQTNNCVDQWVAIDALRRYLKATSDKAKKAEKQVNESAIAQALASLRPQARETRGNRR